MRFASLPPEDIVVVRGFRATSIIRTLIDLSADLSRNEWIRISKQSMAKGLVTLEELRHAAETRDDVPAIDSFRQAMRDLERS